MSKPRNRRFGAAGSKRGPGYYHKVTAANSAHVTVLNESMVYPSRCAVAREQSAALPRWNRALLSDVIRAALTLFLMLGCASCPAATLELDRFVASFILKAFGTTVGRSEWRLVPTEDRHFLWESRSETAGAGALLRDVYITERSESEIHGQSFRPLAYQYDRYGKNATRNVRVTFDWQNEAVFNTAQGHTWRMSLPPGTLDKLNYLLALMGDLVDGKRSMRYTIADGGRLKTYEMREAGDAEDSPRPSRGLRGGDPVVRAGAGISAGEAREPGSGRPAGVHVHPEHRRAAAHDDPAPGGLIPDAGLSPHPAAPRAQRENRHPAVRRRRPPGSRIPTRRTHPAGVARPHLP